MQEVLKAWVGAQGIEGRPDLEASHHEVALLIGPFQTCHRLIPLPQPGVKVGKIKGPHISAFGVFFQSFQRPEVVAPYSPFRIGLSQGRHSLQAGRHWTSPGK